MRKILLVIITCLFCLHDYSQNVSSFTGSFNYSFPLIHLPSNRGTGVSIDASYNAGIQMNQPASEIGLGWNINAGGAIYRSVSGTPDDTKEYTTTDILTTSVSVGQGALYNDYPSYSNSNSYRKTFDLCKIRKGLDTAEFVMPDFDNYTLSSPDLSGQIKLSYYKFYPFENATANNSPYDFAPSGQNMSMNISYRKPQFHFVGDFADTLVARHYPDSINASTPFNIPSTLINGLGYTSSKEPFIGKHLSGSTISEQNFNKDSGRVATSNFVEYFTNAQIDNNQVLNMVDFKTAHARPAANYPPEGIGYFRVTGSNGLTYHYSLPVYQLENTIYRNPLNNDYSSTGLQESDFTGLDVDQFPNNPNGNIIIKSKEVHRYAYKWLLVAITAADYVDVNNNRIVDDADAGYWISYDYKLWNDSYIQRFPKYGYDYQYAPDPATQEYPAYLPLVPSGAGIPCKFSGLFGVANVNKLETYHLNKIRSSSHTAVFIREIRKDEKSDDPAVSTSSAFKPAPDLLLKRIILFKNEQFDSIIGLPCTGCPANFIPANNNEFDFTNVKYTSGIFTENWYTARLAAINNCVLKHQFFDQDYSLCKKYHGNIEVNCTSSVLTPPTAVQAAITVTNNSVTGKLTLNRILTYDFLNQKIIPSTIFDYDKNNLLSAYSNPDYNPLKADYWGYYKSDATANAYSRYTNTYSKDNTDAWSLLKITDPLGGITQMEYESNSYNRVLDNESPNGVRGAAFVYRIKSVYNINGINATTGYGVVMEEANNSSNTVNEFYYLSQLPYTKRICMPYFENKCTNNASCLTSNFFKGFKFADCSITVDNSNIVYGSQATIPATGQAGVSANNTPPSSRYYTPNGGANWQAIQSVPYSGSNQGPAYSGNGFILIETAIGYNVYGSGIRVKRLKVSNSANETYVKEYTYENGVATNEMDRFAYPRLKKYINNPLCPVRYGFLEPKSIERFEMSPYIGYSKVTIKDLGRINADNGKIETTFITQPNDVPFALRKNYSINSKVTVLTSPSYSVTTINECVNTFANIFGATKETRVYDKNNNMMTKSVNEYTITQQGALTELFYFSDTFFGNQWPAVAALYSPPTMVSNTVSIMRDVPVVLKNSITYGMGTYEKTQTIARDELTGETIAMQSEGKNASTSTSFKIPAYKYYHTLEGLDYTSPKSRKIMPYGHEMYTYGNIDTTLTTNNFLTAAYKLYSKTINQRQYNGSTFVTNQVTLPYYFNNRSFVFDAGQGSMTSYGLLDKTKLYTNPLNLSTINNSLYWEPSTTYNWKLTGEVTLMDDLKHPVETRDANNRFSACRYGYKGYYKNSSATNCNYASYTFADFENVAPNNGAATLDGDMYMSNYSNTTNYINYTTLAPHTGSKCIKVNTYPVAFSAATQQSPGGTLELGLQPGRIYRASVWANTSNLSNAAISVTITGTVNDAVPYTINNVLTATSANSLVTTIGNWNLLQLDFEIPEKFVTTIFHGTGEFKIELKSVNGTDVYFDDFVFHPVESDFSASVYNPRNGRLMATIDGNGLATNYFYDASGRVLEVWKEIPGVGYKKIKRHTYNYARGAAN